MVALTIILAFFLILLLYVLFVPLAIQIDTESGIFRMQIKYTGYAGLTVSEEGEVFFELRIWFWRRKMALQKLFAGHDAKEMAKPEKAKKKKKRAVRIKDLPRRIVAIIKSFKIRECYIDVDTGDYRWNGWLYALTWFISIKSNWHISTNFNGRIDIKLFIENNAFRMLKAFITKR